MKLETIDREVLKSGVGEETAFTIKATGKAFQILSSGLYSNKILAIVRELSCNAYDAHVAAGKKDVPIEISLPTFLRPTFIVKDFGIGLSDEQVKTLYTTYFDSTKQDSNDFIGALGLGSKSPFSYVSNFIVESRYNGVKRTYTAFINEKSLPSIVKTGEQKTDESNGMTITIACKQNDLDAFHTAASKALMYFNPMPIVKGPAFEPYSIKHTLAGSNWKLRETNYRSNMSGPYVVQGFVAYPVDTHQFQGLNISSIARAMLDINIDYTVPMGAVDVAASREALSYDPRTIKNLIEQLEHAAKEIHETIQKKFDDCKTGWEAACLYNSFTEDNSGNAALKQVFVHLNQDKEFKWNGTGVCKDVGGDSSWIQKTETLRVGFKFKANNLCILGRSSVGQKEYWITPKTDTIVYIDDQGKHANTMVMNDMLNKNIGDAIILRPTSKASYDLAEIKNILKFYGHPSKVVYVSTLEKPETVKSYVGRKKGTILCWTGFKEKSYYKMSKAYSRLTWQGQEVDFNDGGFYVHLNRFTPQRNGADYEGLDRFIAAAINLGVVGKTVTVYGMNDKEVEQIKGNKKWIELFSYVIGEFEKMNKDNALIQSLIYNQVVTHLNISRVVEVGDKIFSKVSDCTLKTVRQQIFNLRRTANRTLMESHILYLLPMTKDKDQLEKEARKLITSWKKAIGEFPMLSVIDWSKVLGYADGESALIDYMNMIIDQKV